MHVHFRNRHDKLPSPLPNVAHLLHDFFPNIPGQNQEIVRTCATHSFRLINRDMHAGQKMPLLMWAPIYV